MSTIWKLGTFAACFGYSAFVLGSRLGSGSGSAWRSLVTGLVALLCLWIFLRELFRLHAAWRRSGTDLRDESGRKLYP
jgi:hypothetical protein